MKLTIGQERKIKQALEMLFAGALIGPFFVMFADGINDWYPFINGFVVGVVLASVMAILELWVFSGKVRRARFMTIFTIKIFGYVLIIVAVTLNVFLISRMRRFDMSYTEVWHSEEFQNYIFKGDYYLVLIFALVIIAGVNFVRQMSRRLGQGMLLAYISGRYRTPQKEQRIFMLVNLVSSHVIADKLGAIKFHLFINDLFCDMTEPIVSHSGIIAQYVEDEVMVTWSMPNGLNNANCVRTFFQIKEELAALNEKYYEKYGFVPNVRAALHCGPIIRAEIGEVKTEVSFFGDTLNTTSRILGECHTSKKGLLVSEQLKEQIELPVLYAFKAFGSVLLRGKQEEINLFAVKEVNHG